jgi:hypothetical protein
MALERPHFFGYVRGWFPLNEVKVEFSALTLSAIVNLCATESE